MYVFEFCTSMHFVGGVLVPFFTDWGGLTLTQVMIVQSWFMLWIFLLEVPTSTIADKYGRKISVTLGAMFMLAAVVVYTSYPHIAVFLAGEFLWALSGALISGAQTALVYDMLKAAGRETDSKKVFGKIGISFRLAILIAAPIGSVIAMSVGLRETMLFMAFPVACSIVAILLIKEPPDGRKQARKNYRVILLQGIKNFTRSKSLKRLAFNMVSVALVSYGVIWLYQVKLASIGVPIQYFGIVHALIVSSEALVIAAFGRLEKLLRSKRRLLVLSTAVLGGGFLVLAFVNEIVPVTIAILVAGGFGLSRFTLFDSYFNKHIPSEERATTLSTVSMFRTFGQAAFNPLLGIMMDGSQPCTFVILGTAALILAAFPVVKDDDLID